jgi:hypothetical protein
MEPVDANDLGSAFSQVPGDRAAEGTQTHHDHIGGIDATSSVLGLREAESCAYAHDEIPRRGHSELFHRVGPLPPHIQEALAMRAHIRNMEMSKRLGLGSTAIKPSMRSHTTSVGSGSIFPRSAANPRLSFSTSGVMLTRHRAALRVTVEEEGSLRPWD